ncbi:MAG: hypothetical protein JXB49_19335 [Bacteroidales bacterium]|nr:hypothetical protein [Bacteroidales bacterium]
MMNNINFKKIIPHIIAIAIFITINLIYFNPQLSGNKLKQSDNITSKGMSKECGDFREKYHAEPLWTNSMFGGMPAYQISMSNPNIISRTENLILKVMPKPMGYILLMMIGFYILLLCFDIDPKAAIIGAIAFGLSTYNILYMVGGHNSKVHAISLIPPIIGGIIYAYRKNYLIGSVLVAIFTCLHLTANHLQMTYYMLFLLIAVVLAQLYISIKNKLFPSFLKASIFLLIGAMIGMMPPIANVVLTKEYSKYTTRGKSELTISENENIQHTTSIDALDPDYIKQYSFGYSEVLSLVIPNINGGTMGYLGNDKDLMKNVPAEYKQTIAQFPRYWGEQYATGGAFYFGASIFILFLLGAFFVQDKMKWALIVVTLMSAMVSWKYSSITDFFIAHVPLFNKFRDTKMILMLVQICFSLLALLFIKHLIENGVNKKKYIYITLTVSGLLFLFYIAPDTWFNFFSRNENQYFTDLQQNYRNDQITLNQIDKVKNIITDIRISIFRKDCLRSLFFILVTSGVVYAYIIGKIKETNLYIILGLIVLIDLWNVDKRYLNNDKKGSKYVQWVKTYEYANPFTATNADKAILQQEINNNAEINNKINIALSAMDVSKLKPTEIENEKDKIRFRELNFATDCRVLYLPDPFNESRTSYFHKSIGGYHGAKLKKYQELIEYQIHPEIAKIINLLNTNSSNKGMDSLLKYNIPVLNMLNTKYLIYNVEAPPITNPYCYGNAWFVDSIKVVKNADEEILSLSQLGKNDAVVQEKFKQLLPRTIKFDSTATINLISYLPNHLIYESITNSEQIAIFSEIYYDAGWNAYLNGQPAEYFRANYVLRGMTVPPGENTIEFKFEPKLYYKAQWFSKIGSGLIVLSLLSLIIINIRKTKKGLSQNNE